MKSNKCDYKHIALPVAILFSVFYVIFYFWGYTTTDPAVRALHMNLLSLKILGFTGMNGLSFFLGLIQSFIWGLLVAGAFYLVRRFCPCDGCGSCGDCGSCGSCGGGICKSECASECGSCNSDECCGGACEIGDSKMDEHKH